MTSLATLPHTVPAPPPFNGLFYATAATIIPVLFLAIAVQGRLLKVLVTMGRLAHRGVSYQAAAALVAGSLVVLTASLILTLRVASQILAVYARYTSSGTQTAQGRPFLAA